MAGRVITHPSADMLKAFGLGKLDTASAETVLRHLDRCPECRQQVAAQAGDDFLVRLRPGRGADATSAPEQPLTQPPGAPADAIPNPTAPPEATRGAGQDFDATTTAAQSAGSAPGLPPELTDHPHYEVLRELGRGGMGVVYLARHRLSGRQEVLKVMNREYLSRPGSKERFLREIQAAARLHHPNVVEMYTALEAGDLLVLVMEYVEGHELGEVVQTTGPLPVVNACYYAQQAALGLQHAFEQGMVHRDIKPQNLILCRQGKRQVVKILDFGLAKQVSEGLPDPKLTGEGWMMGTPDYVAPEQSLDAATADTRADIYSLGCTLYFLLTGKRPFTGKSLYEILHAHQTLPARPLREVRPEVPAELAEVVQKMMAKQPAERYQRPAEVAEALGAIIKGKGKPAATYPGTAPVAAGSGATTHTGRAGGVPGGPNATALAPTAAQTMNASPFADLHEGVIPTRETNDPEPGRSTRPAWLVTCAVLVGAVACVMTVLLVVGLSGAWLLRDKTDDNRHADQPVEPTVGGDAENQGENLAGNRAKPTPSQPGGQPPGTPPAGPQRADREPAPAQVDPAPGRAYKAHYGNWRRDANELVQAAAGQDGLLLFGDFTWTDYDFAAEVNAVGARGCVSLCFRVAADQRSDFNLVKWNDAHDCLSGASAGAYPTLENCPGGFESGRWYSLRVRVRGQHCQCFRDGKQVFEHEGGIGPRGAVGFRTEVTVVRFRNILVTAPDGKVLLKGLPELPAMADLCFPVSREASADEIHCLKGHHAPVIAVVFSPDGRRLASASDSDHRVYRENFRFTKVASPDSTLRLWDVDTGKELARSTLIIPPTNPSPAYRPMPRSESPFFVQSLTDYDANDQGDVKRLGIWEIAGDRILCRLLLPGEVPGYRYAMITTDGGRLLALNGAGGLWEWNLVSGSLRRKVPGTYQDITCAALAPDGRRALLARKGRALTEVNLDTGAERGNWGDAAGQICYLVYSPDGRRVLAGQRDGTVRLWDVASRSEVCRFSEHRGPISAAAFSADGRRALTGGHDCTVRLWDLVEKRPLGCFTGHASVVSAVQFSPDGRRAASGSGDYSVRLWRLPSSEPR